MAVLQQRQVLLNFEVKTTIAYQIKNQMEFPAITLCNENIYRKSVVANSAFVTLMTGFNGNGDLGKVEEEVRNK